MGTVFSLLFFAIVARFRTGCALEAELLALRHQLLVVHRCRTSRPRLNLIDRLIWIWLYRVWPSCLDTLVIVNPETVVRWHRTGFRAWWRWKSRSHGGRPKIDAAVRRLIREMSRDNPSWGAPRIHGELLRRILNAYARYYDETRTHLALGKDTPEPRPVQRVGRIVSVPLVGGLHHRHVRI